MGKKKVRFRYPKEGPTAVKLTESSSGWIATMPVVSGVKDIHLTLTKEDRAVGRHVSEKRNGRTIHTPLGKVTAESRRESVAFFEAHDVPSDGTEKVYVLNTELFKGGPRPKSEHLPGPDLLPSNEVLAMYASADFSDQTVWRETTLLEASWGLCREDQQVVFLIRRPNGRTCRLPVSELPVALPIIARETGLGALILASLLAPSEPDDKTAELSR